MLQYLPSLIGISVAACMSLASYEIFDSFDEVNPASSEISRISLEPRNASTTTTSRSTTDITIGTEPPTDMGPDFPEVSSDWLPNTRSSTEWWQDTTVETDRLLNTSRASTDGLPDSRTTSIEKLPNTSMAVTEGLSNTSMAATEALSNASMAVTRGLNLKTTTESTLKVTFGYSRRKTYREPTINRTTAVPSSNLTVPLDSCPEEEKPSNIGPYEVPTQRDLVLHIRRILLHMFRSYHKKTLEVLKDMKEATKSSWPKEESCQGASKVAYRRCVRTVSNRCELAAKSLVLALEELRGDVLGLLQGKVCNIEDMNADPIQLIRILAMEKVSLEFALPGFLRLLNACAGHCSRPNSSAHSRKPLRRMLSDQDLVIRHFLTQKSYSQLLKGTT
ncbi:uncharacterized protein isoform X2 [Choristoneura fumiferana]|uniref:uncharacterized protein isoform X1 n=1 Tax=Choristoneura fumiferana TaxID=7141 RepID=UPI003D15A44F